MHPLDLIKRLYATSSNARFIAHLRLGGVKIGRNVIFRNPRSCRVDVSRPSLVSIGDNVDFNDNFQLLTHDWACTVFRIKYHDFVNSSGHVTIGSNIYFGANVIVLKGVTIGDNCVIAAGSLVTHDIPANSVAAGLPCRVICSIDEYYQKRKRCGLEEAREYVRSIRDRYGREPKVSELYEEFIYFVDKHNIADYPELPIRIQLGEGYGEWLATHTAPYDSVSDFLKSIT